MWGPSRVTVTVPPSRFRASSSRSTPRIRSANVKPCSSSSRSTSTRHSSLVTSRNLTVASRTNGVDRPLPRPELVDTHDPPLLHPHGVGLLHLNLDAAASPTQPSSPRHHHPVPEIDEVLERHDVVEPARPGFG